MFLVKAGTVIQLEKSKTPESAWFWDMPFPSTTTPPVKSLSGPVATFWNTVTPSSVARVSMRWCQASKLLFWIEHE
jgi:hypothetical protein